MVDNTDITNPKEEENQEKQQESNRLASFVYDRFITSERARQSDEDRWLEAFHNYRGQYYKNVQFREHEKSRVFVKVTKTKVLAAYGQLIDVLFSANKFPISVEETKVPEGASEYAHLNPVKETLQNAGPSVEGGSDQSMPPEQMTLLGFEGDGRELPKGATFSGLQEDKEFLGSLKGELGDEAVKEGSAPLPEMAQIRPATKLARRMEKLIHDEIDESSGSQELRNAIFESVLLGTGIIKGPFTFNKTLHRYVKNEDGTRSYQPEQVKVPRLEFVSAWDFYPDPNAKNIEECEYVVHRHKLNKNQLRDLLDRHFFDKEAVLETLQDGPNYRNRTFETQIKNEDDANTYDQDRFEVLEFWGCVDKKVLEDAQIPVPEGMDDEKEMQINAWVTENRVLRMVVNPFKPYRIPYNAFPYEKNPYSFFGIGVPENMKDAQQIMNGHARMAIDNLALSGNLVFDIDETQLAPGQDMKIFPGKIFRRQSGQPGTSINAIKFPNSTQENMMMFDRFRQLADEATGIPSYSHGTTGVQSTTRTAAGMSMLMGAAALSIKTVIKNIDDYLIKPLGDSFFHWNMQFNADMPHIKGDLEIKARGTSSLMQKEVRSQRLMTFMQTAANPALAPFVRWHTCLREIAKALDIDPDQLINDPEKAAIYAQIMGMANGNQTNTAAVGEQDPMATVGKVPEGASVTDPTGNGGGNIGVGNIPMPGEAGFASPITDPSNNKQTQ